MAEQKTTGTLSEDDWNVVPDDALLELAKQEVAAGQNPRIPATTRAVLDDRFSVYEEALARDGRLSKEQRDDLQRFCEHFA